jgi:tetratricopeptide (TPR) repeat protein
MTLRHMLLTAVVCALALPFSIEPAHAQATTPADSTAGGERVQALAAVRTCTQLVAAGQLPRARTAGMHAEALLGRYLRRQPRDAEALVALARTLSQCLLPSAEFMEQGEISERAIELLDRALEIEPPHWTGRFALASILFRSPPFLGRGARAARELDSLLDLQGGRSDNPLYARVYELRGALYTRDGQADSARAVWTRGAALFPSDSALTRPISRPCPPRWRRYESSRRSCLRRPPLRSPRCR